MLKEYEIKGLRIEQYIQKINENKYIENQRYIFNCFQNKKNLEIILYWKYINCEEKKLFWKLRKLSVFRDLIKANVNSIKLKIENNNIDKVDDLSIEK